MFLFDLFDLFASAYEAKPYTEICKQSSPHTVQINRAKSAFTLTIFNRILRNMDYNYSARMSQQFRSSQPQQQQRTKKKDDDPDLFMRLVS